MIEVIEFEPRHFTDLILQDAQALAQPLLMTDEYAEMLMDGGPHFSALVDGIVIGCAGVLVADAEPHRGVAWALIAEDIGKDLYHMHKAVKRFLEGTPIIRVEMSVNYNFDPGHRWARMLGFKAEGVMRKYYPDGSDAIMYARVQ